MDQGNNVSQLGEDQRALARVVGVGADAGAFELQPGEAVDRIFNNGFSWLCDQ